MCSAVVTVYISRWSKKRHSSEAAPNTQELDITYEEVDTLQSQTIRLERNAAYVPVKQSQKIELKENVAYMDQFNKIDDIQYEGVVHSFRILHWTEWQNTIWLYFYASYVCK